MRVSKLVRKNRVVDAAQVRGLARQRGTRELEAVRQTVDHAPAAEDVMAAIRELHASGGIAEVFGRSPDAGSDESAER